MPTLLAVPTNCPKCGGQGMWDNRLTKKNPKQPDFKCKNRACDGCVWPPKNGEMYADQIAPAPAAPLTPVYVSATVIPPNNGPALTHGQLVAEKLNELFASYDLCFSRAIGIATQAEKVGVQTTLEGLSSIAATLLISAREKGLV